MLQDLYRKLVMEHAKYRRNYYKLDDALIKLHYKNPTCGDIMTLYLNVENDLITQAAFEGEGCSISMASCSMMTELVKGKRLEDVAILRAAFERLIRDGVIPTEVDLGDALALEGVHKLPARYNCALMPWQALDKAMLNISQYPKLLEE